MWYNNYMKNNKELLKNVYKHFFNDIKEDEILCPILSENLPIKKIGNDFILEYYNAIPIFSNLLKKSLSNYDLSKKNLVFIAANNSFGRNAIDYTKSLFNTFINVFYPQNEIEKIYELMMTTCTYQNVNVVGVKGSAYNCIEAINNLEKTNFSYSTLDENNVAVLIPRILYLFFTYTQMIKDNTIKENEKVNIFISNEDPTYIEAIKIASSLGLPISNLLSTPIADISEVNKKIKEIFTNEKYLIDPYTACSLIAVEKYKNETADTSKNIILSLTSPFIYARTVDEAIRSITYEDVTDEYSFFEDLELLSGNSIPPSLKNIYGKRIMHYDVIDKNDSIMYITKLLENIN